MDPRTRLLLLACVGVLALALERPTSLAILAAVTVGTFTALPGTGRDRGWRVAGVAVVVWSTALAQGLFYWQVPRTPLVALGPLTLYREGLVHGVVQSLRIVAVVAAGMCVTLTTPVDRLMAALLAFRVPYVAAFLAVTALRFLPETLQDLRVVRDARARRGRAVWRRTPLAWLRLELALIRPVVARSLRRARTLAESLDARGFDPASPRPARRPLAFRWWEPLVFLPVLGVTLAAIAFRVLFSLYVAEVAWFPQLRPLYGFIRAWL